VRVNEVQVIGTHNSSKQETTPAEQAEYDRLIATPGDYDQYLAYRHPALTDQLGRQGVRALELDLWPDPQGGLYAEPLVRRNLGLGPQPEGEWRAGEDDLLTPDDVRVPGLTLEQSVLQRGWPSLRSARGQVAFLMDNDPGPIRIAYTLGRPNLEARAIFTNSRPGLQDAAFIKRNEPGGANTAQIQKLVGRGYLVRTRSDVPLATVRGGSTARRDAAFASGAQLVSTDLQEAGMSAGHGADFVARFPDG